MTARTHRLRRLRPAHLMTSYERPSISALAEMARARKPILRDSTSATTPRITGTRRIRWRFAQETTGSEVTSMSPSGFRTATAQVETPRIITPSSTACPPTGASRLATGLPSGIRASERRGPPFHSGAPPVALTLLLARTPRRAPLEPLHPATGVDELLLTGVERMARRADLDVQLRLGGARVELVAARTAHVGKHVFGMDPGLHPL